MEQIHKAIQKHKWVKLPLRAYLTYLVLISFMLSGVTFSKYITTANGGDMARVSTIGELTITESKDSSESGNLIISPGVNLKKDAEISFEGSEAACYLFVEVKASGWNKQADNVTFTSLEDKVLWQIADDWKYLLTEDNGHVYYEIIPPNTVVTSKDIIKDDENDNIEGGVVTVESSLTKTELSEFTQLKIEFQATAAQYDGTSDAVTEEAHAKEAWNAVKSK